MYIEMNPIGLTLSDLICVAHRKRSEDTGFPYAVQSCRCSNCRYVSEGKCSLKECCCMAERVKAHTCTFTEILNTCFANVKDNVFHYRLRLAAERVTMAKTCFLDREHRARFQKALHRVRGNDKSLIAQLFVLTATESLWSASDDAVGKSSISYLDKVIGMIIAVVIGGLLLAGLYALFNNTVLPGLTDKIQSMFS